MKSYLFAIVLLYSTTSVFSQNLVPNSDFETHVPCASLTGDISHDAPPWHGPLNNSYTPYYNNCNAFYYYSVPHNLFNSLGFQYPHSGNAYSIVVVYADFQTNTRFYIQTPTLTNLLVNFVDLRLLKHAILVEFWIRKQVGSTPKQFHSRRILELLGISHHGLKIFLRLG